MFYAWVVNPVIATDVSPWQLNHDGRVNWLIAVSVAWAHDNDIVRAANRLNDLHLNAQTFQAVADTACDLARSSYAQSQAGLIAIRSMVSLAQGQGKTGCASTLISLNTDTPAPTITVLAPTATLLPPPSKTPTLPPGPTFTPGVADTPVPTTPAGSFQVVRTEPYCSVKAPGLLEVLVQDTDGTGIPGMAVEVDWPTGKDHFFTGLKPEKDDGYADFTMTQDESYTVVLTGLGQRSDTLTAAACTDRQAGGSSITSYRLYFRRIAH